MALGQMDPKNFVLPISTLSDFEYKGSIQYFGPVIWYSIPAKIRNAKTMSSFKKKKIENGSHQIVNVNFV